VRTPIQSCLAAIVALTLITIPSFAANEKPLGLVTQAEAAHLGNAPVVIGTSVYTGDTLTTDEGGAVRMRVGGSQFYLLASSAATLSVNSSTVNASVDRGTVGFTSNGEDQIALEIPEGILRAANGQPAYGQVTILSPLEVIISAYRGTLVLDNDGELHEIPAGKSYRVTMDLEPASKPQQAAGVGGPDIKPVPLKHARRRHLLFDIIVVSMVGATSWALWYEWSMTPSAPSNLTVQ
jgi:hypothetical protein